MTLQSSVRHYSTRDILRCHLTHKGSRQSLVDWVKVPDTQTMRRRAQYTFCGTCDRSIPDRRWCDRCDRPEGYVSRLSPLHWMAIGWYAGTVGGIVAGLFR